MKRKCYKCHIKKLLSEFAQDKSQTLGREYICRLCKSIKFKKWWQGKGGKDYRIKNRKRMRQTERRSVAKYPERDKARRILREAVKSGKVVKKPCEVCQDGKSQAHHPDYNFPLQVIWLCRKHHQEVHTSPLKKK